MSLHVTKEGEPRLNGLLNPMFSEQGSPQKNDWVAYFTVCGLVGTPDTQTYQMYAQALKK